MNTAILYNEYAKGLTGDYKKAYEKIYIYTCSTLFIGNNLSIVMNEVVDILLSAQQDNRSIESVIGTNIKGFCDQLLDSYKISKSKSFLNFFFSYWVIASITAIFMVLDTIIDYSTNSADIWQSNVYIGNFIFGLIIGLIVSTLLGKIVSRIAFTKTWYTMKVDTIITTLIIIAMFIFLLFSFETIDTWFGIPRWLFLPAIILYSCTGFLYKRKMKIENKEDGIFINFTTAMSVECLLELQKKYKKYCKKCQKKNIEEKPVALWYDEKYKKEISGYKKLKIGFILLIVIASIIAMINSTFLDGIIFIIILTCVEVPIYLFSCKGKNIQIKIHDLIQQKNTDIFDETIKDELYNG